MELFLVGGFFIMVKFKNEKVLNHFNILNIVLWAL